MGFGLVAGLASAGLASLAMAEDLLFHSTMMDTQEYTRATTVLGYTVHVATPEEWNGYTTADFERYRAVVIPDPTCGTVSEIDFFDATKAAWGPAIMGNIILIGTDPSFHASSRPGALTLIDDAVQFSASGNGTGLYFALSCYYDSVAASTVEALSYFGTITVRGQLACYNDAHLVANSSALGKLDDASLSDWSCSVHEVFTSYPTTGLFGFEPLAIAEGATGDGQRDFADGSNGIPYIIVKGATPAGCGDGIWDPSLEEERLWHQFYHLQQFDVYSIFDSDFSGSFVYFFLVVFQLYILCPNDVDELYAGPDKLKVQPCPSNLERIGSVGSRHFQRCNRFIPLIISPEREYLFNHLHEPAGILRWGVFQLVRKYDHCSPSLGDSFSASSSLLRGGWEQHTRGKWHFFLGDTDTIVCVVHKFKLVSIHRGYDCSVNYFVPCGRHEFYRGVNFVCHYSNCELELKHLDTPGHNHYAQRDNPGLFTIFQHPAKLDSAGFTASCYHHCNWASLINCVIVRGLASSAECQPKCASAFDRWVFVRVCGVFRVPHQLKVRVKPVLYYLDDNNKQLRHYDCDQYIYFTDHGYDDYKGYHHFKECIQTDRLIKNFAPALNITGRASFKLEFQRSAFFGGIVLRGTIFRGTVFRDAILGVLILSGNFFDYFELSSAVIFSTEPFSSRGEFDYRRREPELTSNDHHKSCHHNRYKSLYDANHRSYYDGCINLHP
ncbi:hypothetical protein VMCG_09388 [Cytospora schulzeri]|uniref:Uncharacterized protein n=1 Tax=Cytospora schulzeri TaxID=448051 RepID=A0A423VIK7_9PEZI|nr:hypothetical protein VMCG_09388 [Valsa malicola]